MYICMYRLIIIIVVVFVVVVAVVLLQLLLLLLLLALSLFFRFFAGLEVPSQFRFLFLLLSSSFVVCVCGCTWGTVHALGDGGSDVVDVPSCSHHQCGCCFRLIKLPSASSQMPSAAASPLRCASIPVLIIYLCSAFDICLRDCPTSPTNLSLSCTFLLPAVRRFCDWVSTRVTSSRK